MVDFYVSTSGSDSATGTASAPLRKIQTAASRATAGTTVHVAPGVYAETLTSSPSGTATAPIRYVSDQKWGAILRPTSATVPWIWRNQGSYVTIDGFEVDGSGVGSFTLGIDMQGSHTYVRNCHVHHIWAGSTSSPDGGSGIVLDGARFGQTDQNAIGNVVHDIGNGFRLHQGIYHQSTGTIANNVVWSIGDWGITTWHDVHDVNIVNNTICNNRGGILVGAGDFYGAAAPADRCVVANNIIYGSAVTGLQEEGSVGRNNTYTNNLFFNNRTNAWMQFGGINANPIIADPLFVNAAGRDYRLTSGSPAIGRATLTYAPTTDLLGNARTSPDLGAYEFVSAAPAPTPPAPTPTPPPAPVIISGMFRIDVDTGTGRMTVTAV